MKAVKFFTLAFLAVGLASCSDDDGDNFVEQPEVYSEVFVIGPDEWEEDGPGWQYWAEDINGVMQEIHEFGAVLVYLNIINENDYDPLPFKDLEERVIYNYYTNVDGVGISIQPEGSGELSRPGHEFNCKIVYLYAADIQAQGLSKEEVKTMSLKEVESRFNLKAVTK